MTSDQKSSGIVNENDVLPTIARCQKCGRGFVWISPNSDMIDHYEDARRWRDDPSPCGGEIKILELAR